MASVRGWYARARLKKVCIIVIAFGLVLLAALYEQGLGGQFDWLEVASAYFGMSEGKFMFFFIIFTTLLWTLIIAVVLYYRRKKKEMRERIPSTFEAAPFARASALLNSCG